VGAHAKGRNAHSIGIALIGYDEFTLLQKMSLTHLIEELNGNGEIKHIERHHEKCPGKGLQVEAMAKYLLQKKYVKTIE
jgi:hypothetical protein